MPVVWFASLYSVNDLIRSRVKRAGRLVVFGGTAVTALWLQPANAYTPESKEVKQLLNRALRFLDAAPIHDRLGGKSLMALAAIKGNRPPDHPKVVDAIADCQLAARRLAARARPDTMYDLGLAIIFLSELDADKYRTEINELMKLMIGWQKSFGGWGYLEGSYLATGDTSMTQYAVLATWTADRTGAFPVDVDSATGVANWLLRTQDPSGGWGYQGVDPGDDKRVKQNGVQHSLSAAGLGSMYVLADVLGLNSGMRNRARANGGLPPALRIVREKHKRPSRGPLTDDIDRARLKRSVEDGDQWFKTNFRIDPPDYVYYYMYALERYKSFRELARGEERNPEWYNKGVEFLQRTQNESGAWDATCGAEIDTSFGVLFLVRGTRKSIRKAAAYDGRLRGGRGLPTNTADVKIGKDGQIVKTPFQGRAESLLAILESAGGDDFDAVQQDFQIQLSDDAQQRQQELERISRLVTADEFHVRLAAIKVLYNARELDSVPVFIYALGDPDPRIVTIARDALRLISRRIDGMGLSDDPTPAAKIDAIARWKEWFLAIRPDAQFLN